MDSLLQAKGVQASYDQRAVLKGIDLTVDKGEVLGLIGTNGAGKSTMMKVFSGGHAFEGEILLAGKAFKAANVNEAAAAGVGLIPQNFRLEPEQTVAQAIFRSSKRSQESHDSLTGDAAKIIAQAGAQLDPNAKVSTLVRAQQALVEVLRMVAQEAQLVIMDEVGAALPDHDVATLHHVIRLLTAQGRAIIYITHRLDEVRSIASHIAVLRDGKVYKELPAQSVSEEELAFLLLQSPLEKNPRPLEPVSGESVLDVKNLTVGTAVKNVSFNVAKGEIFGLTGAHTSGLYQLIDALVGVKTATLGEIAVHGKSVKITSPQVAADLKIGYLSDEVADREGAAPSVTDSLRKDPDAPINLKEEVKHLRTVIELVRKMRINTTNIHGTIATLSGGDQQKIDLAKWMMSDCDLLILSHPSRGIDIGAKEVAYKMLAELAKSGVAVILISSDMSELISWCHRIGVMRDGGMASIELNANANEDKLIGHMFGATAITAAPATRRGRRAAGATRPVSLADAKPPVELPTSAATPTPAAAPATPVWAAPTAAAPATPSASTPQQAATPEQQGGPKAPVSAWTPAKDATTPATAPAPAAQTPAATTSAEAPKQEDPKA